MMQQIAILCKLKLTEPTFPMLTGTGTIYLNAKAREAKIEEEKHKKSMGKTNEYYEGDSAYNTIRRLDSPTASEGRRWIFRSSRQLHKVLSENNM